MSAKEVVQLLERLITRFEEPDSSLACLEAEVSSSRASASSLDNSISSGLASWRTKDEENKSAVADLADTFSLLNARCEDLSKRSAKLRLGGACRHGADKGLDCLRCGREREGEYVSEPAGVEIGDYWFKQLEREAEDKGSQWVKRLGKETCVRGNVLEKFALRLAAITQRIDEVDDQVRYLRDSLSGSLKKKLRVLLKRHGISADSSNQKSSMNSNAIVSPLSPNVVETNNSHGRKRRRVEVVDNTGVDFRRITVKMGLLMVRFFVHKSGLSEEQKTALKRFLASRPFSEKVPIVEIKCTGQVEKVAQQLVLFRVNPRDCEKSDRVLVHVKGLKFVAPGCREEDAYAVESQTDVFTLDTGIDGEDGSLFFTATATFQPPKKNNYAWLARTYTRLCHERPRWSFKNNGPRAEALAQNILLHEVLQRESASSKMETLNLSSMSMDDDHLVVVCILLCCCTPQLQALDMSLNCISNFSPLCLPLQSFERLESLRLRCSTAIRLSRSSLCSVFQSITSTSTRLTLQLLDLSFLSLVRFECICSRSCMCEQDHFAMQECIESLANLLRCTENLRELVLDGCFTCHGYMGPNRCNMNKQGEAITKGIVSLAESVSQCTSLEKISFQGCTFHAKRACQTLVQAILGHPRIELISMGDTSILSVLGSVASQAYVDLGGLLLEHAQDLNHRKKKKLSKLCFRSSNILSDNGVVTLSKGIQQGCFSTLRMLDLAGCKLTGRGARSLFDGLSECKARLAHLNLNNNPAVFAGPRLESDVVLQSFSDWLSADSSLETLQLTNVGVHKWPSFLELLRKTFQQHVSFSHLANLELGEQQRQRPFHACVQIADVLALFEEPHQQVATLRLWGAGLFMQGFDELESDNQFPPAFISLIASQPENKEITSFVWDLPITGSAIDIRRPVS